MQDRMRRELALHGGKPGMGPRVAATENSPAAQVSEKPAAAGLAPHGQEAADRRARIAVTDKPYE